MFAACLYRLSNGFDVWLHLLLYVVEGGGGLEACPTLSSAWHPLPFSVHPRSLSGEVCDALPQFGLADEGGFYGGGVDDHEDDAYVDGAFSDPCHVSLL